MSDQFFCIHGGISENIKTVDDIRNVNRFAEPPQKGAACDVLWADPMEDFDTYNGEQRFFFNDIRSCSCVFSYKAACDFLDRNHLRCIIRAHEAQDEGLVFFFRLQFCLFFVQLQDISSKRQFPNCYYVILGPKLSGCIRKQRRHYGF